ncbi:cell wall-binding repeat-containing protein, partial [Corynebacterium nasicanis]
TMPPMLATDETSLAAIATARAAGAEVHVLSHPDPRITAETMALVSDQDVLALGEQFGSRERLHTAIDMASHGELPGGGGLVFPGRRMIAFYGHPSGDALGVMGEQPPAEAVERVKAHIENYQVLEEQPVVPAFEIIVTVASEFPGDDGKFTNVGNPEDFRGYIDAITEAGGYAFLDLQPGQATFLEQAKVYEDLLKLPNVGLALDPEWNLQPGEQPLQRVGHAEAAEINEVADWLAQLVRDNDLPQKGLIVHQFQVQMLRDRDQIITDRPELAFILHADGHGTPGQKMDTWHAMREGLTGEWFMAWKNFIDEDTPTFTPEETYNNVDPRPWFVSYQ